MDIAHEKMTIVYSKMNGDVNFIYEDEQKAEVVFGDNYEACLPIYDLVILDYDNDAFNNAALLKVVDGQLKLKNAEVLQKYL